MAETGFRTLLVVGKNHAKIARKYSADKKGEPFVKYKKEDVTKLHITHLKVLEKDLKNTPQGSKEYNAFYEIYKIILEMSDEEFFEYLADDELYSINENGDIV